MDIATTPLADIAPKVDAARAELRARAAKAEGKSRAGKPSDGPRLF